MRHSERRLAVAGATPCYLSAGFILEEGLPLEVLDRVAASMGETARAASSSNRHRRYHGRGARGGRAVHQHRGRGQFPAGAMQARSVAPWGLPPGQRDHRRPRPGGHAHPRGFAFQSDLVSDCAPLHDLVASLLEACPGSVRTGTRPDPRRPGLAAQRKWALAAGVGLEVAQASIPLREDVRAACELLGLDPLHAANEGKVVAVAPEEDAESALAALRALGQEAAVIGQVTAEHAGRVVLRTLARGACWVCWPATSYHASADRAPSARMDAMEQTISDRPAGRTCTRYAAARPRRTAYRRDHGRAAIAGDQATAGGCSYAYPGWRRNWPSAFASARDWSAPLTIFSACITAGRACPPPRTASPAGRPATACR